MTIDTQGDQLAGFTRPEIDRVGSAWLIRKFIDPEAKFVFGDEPAAHPEAIPYDMLDVEFSHHGDHCTFETLIDRFGIRDRTVQRLAELIHDADLEDDKFHRIDSTVTAAVVGLVLNLTVWFGLHVILPSPGTVDSFAVLAGIVAFAGMVRRKWDIVPIVLNGSFAGLIFKMFLSHLIK